MVDRPRDKPQIERDAALASALPQDLSARDIIAYLRQNPDFLDRHPQALRLLPAPSRGGGGGGVGEAGVRGEGAVLGGAGGLVRSQALLRVSIGRSAPTGLLCIGARRAGRFHPGLGTELLSFLARVLGITISQWLSPGR